MNYYKLFLIFSKVLSFTIRSSYLLKAIMIPNFFCFKLFKNYGSYNLNKFVINKNVYLDSNFQFFFNKKNKVQTYNFRNFFLNKKNFSIVKINENENVSDNTLISYNNSVYKFNDLKYSYNYYIYIEFFSIISFLIYNNNLNMYKLYMYLIFNNKI